MEKEKKNWFRRHWIISIFLGLILLGFFNGIFMGISEESSGERQNIGTGSAINTEDNKVVSPEKTQEKIHYGFGEEVSVGDFSYIFHDMSTSYEIGESYGYGGYENFLGEEADGVFLIFDVTIENIGTESKTMWGSYVNVIDDQDRTFEYDSIAEIYLDDSFSFEQMQPGLPKRGKIVFDVPEDLKGYLEISSNKVFSSETKYVSWKE